MRWNDYDDIPTKVYHRQHCRVIVHSNEITIIAFVLFQHLNEKKILKSPSFLLEHSCANV